MNPANPIKETRVVSAQKRRLWIQLEVTGFFLAAGGVVFQWILNGTFSLDKPHNLAVGLIGGGGLMVVAALAAPRCTRQERSERLTRRLQERQDFVSRSDVGDTGSFLGRATGATPVYSDSGEEIGRLGAGADCRVVRLAENGFLIEDVSGQRGWVSRDALALPTGNPVAAGLIGLVTASTVVGLVLVASLGWMAISSGGRSGIIVITSILVLLAVIALGLGSRLAWRVGTGQHGKPHGAIESRPQGYPR